MQPILESKLTKSDYLPLFAALAFRNGLQYRRSDFRKLICDDLAALCANLVNFGSVTPEFTKVKDVRYTPSLLLKINLSVKLCLDLLYRFSPHFHLW